MNETVGVTLIGVGLLFDLFGCIGLARLPDVYNRLQAGTKCVTLGTCLILAGTGVVAGAGAMAVKAALCVAFLLLTCPVAAHALARGAYRSGVGLWPGSVMDRYGEARRTDTATSEEQDDAQA